MRVLPAPRGTGIVSGPVAKKILALGGIKDCFVTVCGENNNQGHLGTNCCFKNIVLRYK